MLMRSITFSCGHLWLMTHSQSSTPTRCLVCGCDAIRAESEVHVTLSSLIDPPESNSPKVDACSDAMAKQREVDSRTVTWFLAESGFRIGEAPGPNDSPPHDP